MQNNKRSLSLLKTAAQMEAVADKLKDADRMKQLTGKMSQMTAQLKVQLGSMDMSKIQECMKDFGAEFNDLDVISATMDDQLNAEVDKMAPVKEVDAYLKQLADKAKLEMSLPGSPAMLAQMQAQGNLAPGAMLPAAGGGGGLGGQPPGAPGGPPGGGFGGPAAGGGGGGDDLNAKLARLQNMGK
jgi:division protein CdvB (Snf7/Vps24/ESCRT-III family)